MFRRGEGDERHEPIQPREIATPRGEKPEVTTVAKGAHLDGNLISAGSLQIDGEVTGKITADGDVRLSPQSRVEADIEADNVVVAGSFKGNITAKSRAELSRGGRVDGNITSKTLIVAEGAFFSGQSVMDAQPTQPGGGRRPPERPTAAGAPSVDVGAPSGGGGSSPPETSPTGPIAPGGAQGASGPDSEATRTGT